MYMYMICVYMFVCAYTICVICVICVIFVTVDYHQLVC